MSRANTSRSGSGSEPSTPERFIGYAQADSHSQLSWSDTTYNITPSPTSSQGTYSHVSTRDFTSIDEENKLKRYIKQKQRHTDGTKTKIESEEEAGTIYVKRVLIDGRDEGILKIGVTKETSGRKCSTSKRVAHKTIKQIQLPNPGEEENQSDAYSEARGLKRYRVERIVHLILSSQNTRNFRECNNLGKECFYLDAKVAIKLVEKVREFVQSAYDSQGKLKSCWRKKLKYFGNIEEGYYEDYMGRCERWMQWIDEGIEDMTDTRSDFSAARNSVEGSQDVIQVPQERRMSTSLSGDQPQLTGSFNTQRSLQGTPPCNGSNHIARQRQDSTNQGDHILDRPNVSELLNTLLRKSVSEAKQSGSGFNSGYETQRPVDKWIRYVIYTSLIWTFYQAIGSVALQLIWYQPLLIIAQVPSTVPLVIRWKGFSGRL